jgi:predicted DCC family thiol-disulfide oxidoreductase YuxK
MTTTMAKNSRGQQIALPSKTPWKAFEEARRDFERLADEQRKTAAKLRQLGEQREQALADDRVGLAEALRAGKKDPGTDAVEKIDREIAATKRTVSALELAVIAAWDDVVQVVEQNRERWFREQEKQVEQARRKTGDYLAAYTGARETLVAERAMLTFLRSFPDRGLSAAIPAVATLRAPNGEPTHWRTIVAALEADVDPPPVKSLSTQAQEADPLVAA